MPTFNVILTAKVVNMAGGANNRRATRAFVRTHARMIRDLKKFLIYTERADARAIVRATANGVTPITFTGLDGVSVQAAIDTLKARCTAALAKKV